jgi:hypothetical protein
MDKDTIRARNAEFAEQLAPLVAVVGQAPIDDPERAVRFLNHNAPVDGALVTAVRETAQVGLDQGWLVYKGEPGLLFGRVAKDLDGFSVDAVRMDRAGPRHRHPDGEIDLCLTLAGEARFDGHPQGWVVYPPGSVHTPTVTGGEMLVLYFLPGGAFQLLG